MLPLDELKQLDYQVESATRLSALKRVYERLAEIARQYPGDFDVQVAVADVQQRAIDKGVELRRGPQDGPQHVISTEARRSAARAVGIEESHSASAPVRPPEVKQFDFRRWVVIVSLVSAAWLIVFVVLVQIARNRNLPPQGPALPSATKAGPGTVPVDIRTVPPGASIQINGDTKCKSDCRVDLTPGNYQVTATRDGFDPAATGVTVVPGNVINVSLNLVSQTQTVRLLTDLDGGNVAIDGQRAGELQDGQLVLDRVVAGKHTVRVAGRIAAAAFTFEGQSGRQPVIDGSVAVTNVFAIVVTSLGGQAKVMTSSNTPLKVALNGQPVGEAGPQGLDLKNVPAGALTLAVGEGNDVRKLVVSFGPMPTVTAFLKSDVSTGTLVIAANEDDATVFMNGREYPRKTKRGELRIQTVGDVTVRVAKPGFQPEAEQRATVVKGEEVKVAFRMKPLARMAALHISNGVPGTQIVIEDRVVGRVGPDGTLSAANLTPGEHAIEARRDGFLNRRVLRTLKAGETLVLSGADIALTEATGAIHLVLTPPEAAVTYHRTDESQSHTVHDTTLRLEPGSYVFTGRLANFVERTERVTVVAGETRSVEITLDRERRAATAVAATAPVTTPSLNWAGWQRVGADWVHKGGNRVVMKSGPFTGIITFTAHMRKGGGIFRGGKLRWFVEDGEGYSQFEVDKKRFQARGPGGSRSKEYERSDEDSRAYTIQIEMGAERIVHRMKIGESWIVLDSRKRTPGDAQFGFVIPSNDEIGVSELRITGR